MNWFEMICSDSSERERDGKGGVMHSGTKKINKKTKENWQKTYFFFSSKQVWEYGYRKQKEKKSFNHYKYIEKKNICIDNLFFIKKKKYIKI